MMILMNDPSRIAISIVMPVFEGRRYLERSLRALSAQVDAPSFEVIVVDDGSEDGSDEFAREHGARVVPSGGRRLGPARGRNVGARVAAGKMVIFVDADVAMHADTLAKFVRIFEDPETTAAYGSYDSHPPHPGFASQYMNLRHHFVHQTPNEDAATFWSGLGAVRRADYLAVDGFDAEAFDRPCVEDIELGMRIRAAGGRIRRRPDVRGTHLKQWGLMEVVRTDVFRRAVPWSRMILRHPGVFTDLNVSSGERLKAILAATILVSAAVACTGLLPLWIPLALLLVAGIANRRLIVLFAKRNGIIFAFGALLYHQVYYVYGTAAYVWCLLEHLLRQLKRG